MKRNNNKGFTLAELLIVVAVIAVLVAVAIPTFGSQLEKSRQAVDLSNLRGAYAAAKMAVLNQDDTDAVLQAAKNAKNATSGKREARNPAVFWYDPDAGTLTEVTTAKTVDPKDKLPDTFIGKATTASVVVNTDGIPGLIQYTNDTLKAVDVTGADPEKGVSGTTDKGILVTFSYTESADSYSISSVTFTRTARVANKLTVDTNDATQFTNKLITLKADNSEGTDSDAPTEFDPTGLKVTVTYDEGGAAGDAVVYNSGNFTFQTSTNATALEGAQSLAVSGKIPSTTKSIWVTYEGNTEIISGLSFTTPE